MLYEKITKDYIVAMKARDSFRSSTINFLRAQLKNICIEKRVEILDDADVISVLKKQVKQRKDSIEQFTAGNRAELAEKETNELNILLSYLPEQMSDEEISKIVVCVIADTGASSMKDMGAVMKEVGVKTAGMADNKVVSELVKKTLMGK